MIHIVFVRTCNGKIKNQINSRISLKQTEIYNYCCNQDSYHMHNDNSKCIAKGISRYHNALQFAIMIHGCDIFRCRNVTAIAIPLSSVGNPHVLALRNQKNTEGCENVLLLQIQKIFSFLINFSVSMNILLKYFLTSFWSAIKYLQVNKQTNISNTRPEEVLRACNSTLPFFSTYAHSCH